MDKYLTRCQLNCLKRMTTLVTAAQSIRSVELHQTSLCQSELLQFRRTVRRQPKEVGSQLSVMSLFLHRQLCRRVVNSDRSRSIRSLEFGCYSKNLSECK